MKRLVKPSLRFAFSCGFFVSTGNLFRFLFRLLPSREMQLDSLILVPVGDTSIQRCQENFYTFLSSQKAISFSDLLRKSNV